MKRWEVTGQSSRKLPVGKDPARLVARRRDPTLRSGGSAARQRKHRELAAERCVVLQGGIATNGAQAGGGIRQPGGKTDTCPAADAGQDRNVLLAAMFIGGHVADDAGGRLELVEFLAGLGVDGLEVAFERAVEHHAAGGRQGTRPCREADTSTAWPRHRAGPPCSS